RRSSDLLIEEFSSRSREIEDETTRLIDAYTDRHGRVPSATTILKLRAQATLSTRPAKQVHSLADITRNWRTRATNLLGEDATSWATTIASTTGQAPVWLRADDEPLGEITERGRSGGAGGGEERSRWRRWTLHAETSRQRMALRFSTALERDAVTGMVTNAAEQASLRLTPPELASSPARFQRPDVTSRFRHVGATVFSTEAMLAAEDRLLTLASTTTGPTIPLSLVEKITQKLDADGRRLGPDQTEALTRI